MWFVKRLLLAQVGFAQGQAGLLGSVLHCFEALRRSLYVMLMSCSQCYG